MRMHTHAEALVNELVGWIVLLVECIGVLIVLSGVLLAIYQCVAGLIRDRSSEGFTRVRLTLARYLALALEFQLGADILSTAVSPEWDQIGKLAAIAVIRTGLNYFLTQEMNAEKSGAKEPP